MMLARDLSGNGMLRLAGADRARFLHGMVTNDVNGLTPGQGCHAAMLTVKGKLLGDLRVYCDEDALWLETDPGATAKIRAALEQHVIMDDVTIEDAGGAIGELGVWGEGARAVVEAALGALPELLRYHHLRRDGLRVAADRDFARDGFRLFGEPTAIAGLARSLAASGAPLLDEGEAEIRRIEAGRPRYGVDMGEDHLPMESGLDDVVSFTKGCYLGQEVIVRVTQQGRINRRLAGLRLDGAGPVSAGEKLHHPSRPEAATVTSSVVSPRLGPLALAYVHRTVWEPGTQLTSNGGRVGTVTALPFPGYDAVVDK